MNTFFSAYPVAVPFIAILSAEIVKALIDGIRHRKEIRFLHPGGMPSGHSAFMGSLVVLVAMREGVGSVLFAVIAVLAVIVMFDAIHLRREAGLHASALNQLQKNAKLEESLGHTHLEVVLGALFGGILSFLLLNGF